MSGAVTRLIGAAASVPPAAAAPASRFNPKYLPLAATVSLFIAMATLGSVFYSGFSRRRSFSTC